MVKIDIYGGLLGSGKTTLIRQMLGTAYQGYKVAIVENEFGKVSLDDAYLSQASIEVKNITSGCVCCTLKGIFSEAVRLLLEQERPDYIIIEPSGMADFQTVGSACTEIEGAEVNRAVLVVNGRKIVKLLKVAGEFLYEQIRTAHTVFLNFCETMEAEQVEEAMASLRAVNPKLHIIRIPIGEVDGLILPDGKDEREILVSAKEEYKREHSVSAKEKDKREHSVSLDGTEERKDSLPADEEKEDEMEEREHSVPADGRNKRKRIGNRLQSGAGTLWNQEIDRLQSMNSVSSGEKRGAMTGEREPLAGRQMRTAKQGETDSWNYTFTRKMTEEMLQKLGDFLTQETKDCLWRGKAFFAMEDGSVCKWDFVYGDIFQEVREEFQEIEEEKRNVLVLIGKRLIRNRCLKMCRELERV